LYQVKAAITYILNNTRTAAHIFIETRVRPYSCRLCTPGTHQEHRSCEKTNGWPSKKWEKRRPRCSL